MELSNHIDTSQTELDQLKDLLAGGQFSVDFGTLSGVGSGARGDTDTAGFHTGNLLYV